LGKLFQTVLNAIARLRHFFKYHRAASAGCLALVGVVRHCEYLGLWLFWLFWLAEDRVKARSTAKKH
jgi:hypothetical protein